MNVLLDQSEIAHVANLIRYARSQQKRRGFFRLYLPDREEIDLIVSAGAKVHSYSCENNSEMYRLELELGIEDEPGPPRFISALLWRPASTPCFAVAS